MLMTTGYQLKAKGTGPVAEEEINNFLLSTYSTPESQPSYPI